MNKIKLAGDNVCLYHADMRAAIKMLPDNSIDSVVCDPPYHLTSIVKRFGGANAAPAQYGSDGAFARASKGFMNKVWDGGDIAFQPETWAECLRVLKPGGHVAAFGASRGYHRMACAIEDAGFEIRDSLMWIYGTGFPKSHDVSKGIDKTRGETGRDLEFCEFMRSSKIGRGEATRILQQAGLISANGTMAGHFYAASQAGQPAVATRAIFEALRPHLGVDVPARIEEIINRAEAEREVIGEQAGTRLAVAPGQDNDRSATVLDITAPATDAARQWEGWGTALKPAFEPIVLARKPLSEGTVAANVLRWGTGALNIDGCRIPGESTIRSTGNGKRGRTDGYGMEGGVIGGSDKGRWPANVVHDGSDEVVGMFPNNVARFFYSAKASKADRAGSKHPTVKPVALMQWLARLITPPGGMVLDPFAGSGTTGAACAAEGFNCVMIEREAEYIEDIKRRMSAPTSLPHVAAAVAAQQPANDNQPRDLFSGLAA